ncbi:MAG: GspH/FimT family pseudopilin [Sulfuricaulis sp.]
MLMRIGHSKGFTLVELIATLVIIALIAVVSGPRFFSINNFQSQGFFDETISAVRYAQKLAVATNCTVLVQITTNGFALFRSVNNTGSPGGTCTTGPWGTPVTDPTGSGGTFTRTAPGSVTLSPAPTSFTFGPDGTASTTVTITIGSGGSSKSFTVYAATGFVQRL